MRSGLAVKVFTSLTSISRQRRKGADGLSALQWASGNAASARLKEAEALLPDECAPCAALQSAAKDESNSTPAHISSTSRSKDERPKVSHRVSRAEGAGSAARAFSTACSVADFFGSASHADCSLICA